jgi:hypothetical protein
VRKREREKERKREREIERTYKTVCTHVMSPFKMLVLRVWKHRWRFKTTPLTSKTTISVIPSKSLFYNTKLNSDFTLCENILWY